MKYKRPTNLFNVIKGVCFPWRIDPQMLVKCNGMFALVQVDVDFSTQMPNKILVENRFELFCSIRI